jgi:hypothetical protein
VEEYWVFTEKTCKPEKILKRVRSSEELRDREELDEEPPFMLTSPLSRLWLKFCSLRLLGSWLRLRATCELMGSMGYSRQSKSSPSG